MAHINQNYLKLPGSYLFSEVNRRITAYSASHPRRQDHPAVHRRRDPPLAPAVIEAMHQAVTEMGTFEGFTAMARSRATTSCGRPLPSTTTPPGAWTSSRRRSSCLTGLRATAATSEISSA